MSSNEGSSDPIRFSGGDDSPFPNLKLFAGPRITSNGAGDQFVRQSALAAAALKRHRSGGGHGGIPRA